MVCLIIVSTPGPSFVRIKARFGQVGDEVGQVKDQFGQGQGQELDNTLKLSDSAHLYEMLQLNYTFQFQALVNTLGFKSKCKERQNNTLSHTFLIFFVKTIK